MISFKSMFKKLISCLKGTIGWLAIVYCLSYIEWFFAYPIYRSYYPPTSEFSGLIFFLIYFPFFSVVELFHTSSVTLLTYAYGASIVLAAVLAVGIMFLLGIRKRTILIISGGMVFLCVLTFFAYKFVEKHPVYATTNKDIFILAQEVAKKDDLSLCSKKIPSGMVSSFESCLKMAAILSGNGKFCDSDRDKDYCLAGLGSANNFISLKCGTDLGRAECLSKYCFTLPAKNGYYSSYDLVHCMTSNARTSLDEKWCKGIVNPPEKSSLWGNERCFNSLYYRKAVTEEDKKWCEKITEEGLLKKICNSLTF